MMFESKDTNVLSSNTIVNRIWEARHKVASDVPLDDRPSFGRIDNLCKRLDRPHRGTERLVSRLVAHRTEPPR